MTPREAGALELEEPDYEHIFYVTAKLKDRLRPLSPEAARSFGDLPATQVRDPNGLERLADGQIILNGKALLGSDVKLLSATLGNLKEGKPGLAKAAALGEQAKRTEPGRKIEVHASLESRFSSRPALVRLLSVRRDWTEHRDGGRQLRRAARWWARGGVA